jgi:hypothetical protein
MFLASLMTSIWAFFERLDRMQDFDPLDAYERRLAAVERELAQIPATPEPSPERASELEPA